jgi:phage host-nuclease inhibitor protein Gam
MKTKSQKTRRKIQLPALRNRTDAEIAMSDLAQAITSQRKVVADRDAAVLAINERCAEPLAELDKRITALTENLAAWAEAHPEEFPKGLKSLRLNAGTIGFRTGTPKLALLSRAWNWEKVLQAVQGMLPNFVRNKPEVDKEAILGQRDELAYILPSVGLKVTQAESFFAEPDLTPMESRQTTNTTT